MKCFAGCSPNEIAAAVGMDLADLFPKTEGGQRIKKPWKYEAMKTLGPDLAGAWDLLKKLEKGNPITNKERIYAGKLAEKCAAIFREI
jgi:hypothetical protein